ncbi:MAG TPA: PmoA family protein, partial [Tepidisphaeraceae bacterium]|nr:PmoA family protein [Tepidisphaeraceae bacterium]
EITSDQIKTNPKEHPHHRSFWVSHGEVNGVNHWAHNDGKQKHLGFDKVEGDTIVQRLEWSGKLGAGPALLNETRTLRFFALEDGTRGIDLTVTLVPAGNEPVTLGDTKEAGLCSVRVHAEIGNGEKDKAKARKGTLTLSTGATGEKNVWGKPAAWCDESGTINGMAYGVAIFDHPSNARHPTCWHSREYGLHAANPFGLHDFDKAKNPKGTGDFKIEPGKPATFKYRVLFHTGDAASAKLDERYKAWTGK